METKTPSKRNSSQTNTESATNKQHTTRKPDPLLRTLDVLVGKWNNATTFKDQPDNSGNGWVSYEWMEGRFFLVEKFDNYFQKEKSHQGMSVIEYDASAKNCVSHFYDNMGYTREYKIAIDGDEYKVIGKQERYSGTISEDENTITGTWEQLHGGGWVYLCDVKMTREV